MRIGDKWRDQTRETGHYAREGDLELIAALGIKTVRYPLLWENIAPTNPSKLNFDWCDRRLAALEELGIEVIAGLLHHGSGPIYTDLLDPDFPAKFADYSARIADRYSHVRKWTPINEPLTTARFSALYGHWYPHRRDYPSFLRALVNQCKGIAAAMEAIRAAVPDALLIQTEDLGKAFSTSALRHQAEHENERRWLSLDLLAGRVRPAHPLYSFLTDAGIAESELDKLATGTATPDLLGINHYLTSDRFLDHRCHLYPAADAGGNGRDIYVDAEAVRVNSLAGEVGLAPRLREAWGRYSIPIAVTEVHHGCTRDEQLRWFSDVWHAALQVRDEGADIGAVTLWSLFGSVDWRSLITRDEGLYDLGAFDIRGPRPRPTALAAAAASLGGGRNFEHPVLATPGWWRRPEHHYAWCGARRDDRAKAPPLLITGATGTLGAALARVAQHRGLAVCLTARSELDLDSELSIAEALGRLRPWAIINAAGFVDVARAERDVEACMSTNAAGVGRLSRAAADKGLPFVTFSSDLVFEGTLGRAYRETDPVSPASVYGHSKALAERLVAEVGGEALLIRTSAFFGPWDRFNFAWRVLEAMRAGRTIVASASQRISPTFVPDLCHAVLDLLIDGERGIWHLANRGCVTWFEFASALAARAGLDGDLIVPSEDTAPRDTALTSERGELLRPLDAAIEAYLDEFNRTRPTLVDPR